MAPSPPNEFPPRHGPTALFLGSSLAYRCLRKAPLLPPFYSSFVLGLAHVVAKLLQYVPDPEEAFWMFVTLMEDYGICCIFDSQCLKSISDVCAICCLCMEYLPVVGPSFVALVRRVYPCLFYFLA